MRRHIFIIYLRVRRYVIQDCNDCPNLIERSFIEKLGIYHESRPLTPELEISDRVRLHVVFMCTVHPATSAVLAVVGDGRSGDPLHERRD